MGYAARCAHCGQSIGVYEPAVLVNDEGASRTSRASRPELASNGDRLFHLECHESLEEDEEDDADDGAKRATPSPTSLS